MKTVITLADTAALTDAENAASGCYAVAGRMLGWFDDDFPESVETTLGNQKTLESIEIDSYARYYIQSGTGLEVTVYYSKAQDFS